MITDPRLLELLAAAEAIIFGGGNVVNRNRLRAALGAIPSEFTDTSFLRSLTPTPTVTAVLNRAVELANASNDLNLRSHHLQFALEEIAPTNQPK